MEDLWGCCPGPVMISSKRMANTSTDRCLKRSSNIFEILRILIGYVWISSTVELIRARATVWWAPLGCLSELVMVISRDFASGLTQYPLICYVSTDANFCLYSMPLFLSHFTVSLRYFVGSASAPHSHAAELGSHCSLLRIQNAPTFFQCSTANFKLRFIYFASWDFFFVQVPNTCFNFDPCRYFWVWIL
jgi:hypothetical protein